MISWVEKKISSQDTFYVGMYEFTEEGDTLVVTPSLPLLGLSEINAIPQILELHESGSSFQKSIRYSLDNGLNWSDSKSFLEFAHIISKEKQCVILEFTFTKLGVSKSWFYGIEFTSQLDYSAPLVPQFYEERKDSIRVPYYNYISFNWTLNVLQKIYKKGIVPSFIMRGQNLNWSDEDYINFWWSLIYPISLRISFSNEFADLLWNPVLLANFLKQRGLILGNISGLDELFYLMSYFYDETLRRGTKSVFDIKRSLGDGSTMRGEFSRLIDLREDSDLFLGLINDYENGWWLGTSSVCNYMNSDFYKNYRLAYENRILNINNYPTLKPTGVSIIINQNTIVKSGGQSFLLSGIGADLYADNQDFLISVSNKREYAIVVKVHLNQSQTVRFGVKAYDSVGNAVQFKKRQSDESLVDSNIFFDKTLPTGDYCFWSMINSSGTAYRNPLDGISNQLQFPANSAISSIVPMFWTNSDIVISDIFVCLLKPLFIYLDSVSKKLYNIYLENNNPEYTQQEIQEIAKKKLLPVNSDFNFNFE